ncbi:MAG: PAS domain-containing protein [Anaerolineae bacterium]|nr:PAS domain-containing protein [Anaerolineae bacterium]
MEIVNLLISNLQSPHPLSVNTQPDFSLISLIHNLPGMVYRCRHDAQRTLLFASDGCRELTGYAAAALVANCQLAFADLIRESDRDGVFEELATAVAETRPYRCIYRIATAAGEVRWVLDKGRPAPQPDGSVVLEGFVSDHTRRMAAFRQLEQQLAEKARKAEQVVVLEERNRLARELHDSVTQSLYSVTLFAEAGRNQAENGQFDRAAWYFAEILATGQQALKEMRLLVHKLRPSALEKDGLVPALQHRLNAVEGRAGIQHQLVVEGEIHLPPEVEEAIYHVSQEALNNAIKHARASEVRVTVCQDDQHLELTVWDNGCGFDVDTAVQSGGLGLTSMRERMQMVGGVLEIKSTPGQGTTVCAQLRLNEGNTVHL